MQKREYKTARLTRPFKASEWTVILIVIFGFIASEVHSQRKNSKSEDEVEIEFITSPPNIRAKVIHGRKTYGTTPFKRKFKKNSGFRDIRVVAEDYLVLNTRFYTNKSHKRVLKLFTEEEASELPGYKKKVPDLGVEPLGQDDAGINSRPSDAGVFVASPPGQKPQPDARIPSSQ